MSNKKQLKDEELEKVSGGEACSDTIEGLKFSHGLGDKVITFNYRSGTVSKTGYLYYGFYWPCVYIVFDNNEETNAWYVDEKNPSARVADGNAENIVIIEE